MGGPTASSTEALDTSVIDALLVDAKIAGTPIGHLIQQPGEHAFRR